MSIWFRISGDPYERAKYTDPDQKELQTLPDIAPLDFVLVHRLHGPKLVKQLNDVGPLQYLTASFVKVAKPCRKEGLFK